MIIAEYDAILGQWEGEDLYGHLSNYTKYIYVFVHNVFVCYSYILLVCIGMCVVFQSQLLLHAELDSIAISFLHTITTSPEVF